MGQSGLMHHSKQRLYSIAHETARIAAIPDKYWR